jgi:hypothetical protein
MPILKSPRHELFAQQIASGTRSAAETYRRAGGREECGCDCVPLVKESQYQGKDRGAKGARYREMRHESRPSGRCPELFRQSQVRQVSRIRIVR